MVPPRPPVPEPVSPACLKPHEVALLLQGQLPPEQRRRVEEHQAGCARCRELLARSSAAPTGPSRSSLHHVRPIPVRPAPTSDATVAGGPAAPARQESRAPPREFEPGARVGRYVIERVLGTGGMGAVYLARDPELHRRVAIKLLHASLSAHPEHQARFLREAQAMASVSHPHVVTVHDILTWEDQLLVAMEYVEGTTLREWMKAPRSTRQVVELFRKAGAGLAAAHAAGLVHRDFKPANVLLGEDGAVRVTDFGLARAAEAGVEAPLPASASEPAGLLGQDITQTGLLMGTPGYMAPEQMKLEPVDARGDQFSFCVALHEALYGVRPFAGRTLEELYPAIEAQRFQKPRGGARVPPWLDAVVRRGLRRAPEERFPSMQALLQALAKDPEQQEETARGLARRRVRRGLALGTLATALVMALAPTSGWRGFEERAQGLLLTARPRPWNEDVVLLAIDQPTIDQVGWPQPRQVQARMLEALARAGVKAVGIDSFLYLPARDGPEADAALGRAISQSGRVVLAAPCTAATEGESRAWAGRLMPSTVAAGPGARFPCERVLVPQAPLLKGSLVAQVEVARSASGNVRGAYLLAETEGRALPTLALSMYLRGLGLSPSALTLEPDGVRVGGLFIPTDAHGGTLASFRLPAAPHVLSYGALHAELAGAATPEFPPELAAHLHGKYVLVGQTAESVRDLGPFANGQTLPLVLLHASMLSDLIEERPVRELPMAAQLALIALCGALLTAAVLALRPSLTFLPVLVVLLGVLGGALLLARQGVVMGPLGPMAATVLSFGLVLAGRISAEERERSRVRHAFEGYVDEAELDRLLSAPREALGLEGARKRVSVLYARVQGPPDALERLPPEEVLREVRGALGAVGEEVLRRQGRVDSVRGDGVLAVFGDLQELADHPRRAVEAAVAVRSRLSAPTPSRLALELRVGVATGEALVGNVGAPGGRWEYAVLGVPLEQARMLAGGAPEGAVRVSAETREACGERFDFIPTPDPGLELEAFTLGEARRDSLV